MSGTAARPQRLSTGAGVVRVLVTLVLFLVVFIAFLLAPLIALGIGFLVYLVWRSRGARPGRSTGATAPKAASGFGAGAA
ncbi:MULTISPECIES: hypothetical protein [unclassified Nocardioides]|uniref:hypothetical protein n=1 Tax=unclassified Nocardioides TaxID=2615069 RepID=UPI00361CEE4A